MLIYYYSKLCGNLTLPELDSYLYQTVGQDAIEYVAQALAVPLYRQSIKGVAVEQSSEYGSRNAVTSEGVSGDETEDLFELLSYVKVQPSAQFWLERFCADSQIERAPGH